ncbi:hypothetical protein O6H91_08G026200 [Diphasiastrum complanatum]|uniref:Uncharacterized protein n=2 Tax=Diphasiastrum complanatum TaxID=34168 RepID=A0ACC2CVS2_DIPCM|nr:hypothetical protein O6H91_08G025800 [Diphasiastrum complanatum]KAJ7546137.1 hypothetical protein O6H91_08G026200 [Diphasiastrum complanatum]
MMLTILASVVALEAGMALLLASNLPPLYKMARRAVDLVKTGKGTAIGLMIFATLLVMLASTIFRIRKIQKNLRKYDRTSHGDQFILKTQIQEASLMGFSLLLGVVIIRLHSYLQQIESLQLQLQISRKQAETAQSEYLRAMSEHSSAKQKVRDEEAALAEVRSLTDVIIDLRLKLERLQLDSYQKDRQIKDSEATVQSLQKQSEGFLLEYDRIVGENENLRMQLSSANRKHYTRLDSRKIL